MSEPRFHSSLFGLPGGVRPALIDLFHSLLRAFPLQCPQSGPLPDRERVRICEGRAGGFQFIKFVNLGDEAGEMRRLGAGLGVTLRTSVADPLNIFGFDRPAFQSRERAGDEAGFLAGADILIGVRLELIRDLKPQRLRQSWMSASSASIIAWIISRLYSRSIRSRKAARSDSRKVLPATVPPITSMSSASKVWA
jgi:hypothetical protein